MLDPLRLDDTRETCNAAEPTCKIAEAIALRCNENRLIEKRARAVKRSAAYRARKMAAVKNNTATPEMLESIRRRRARDVEYSKAYRIRRMAAIATNPTVQPARTIPLATDELTPNPVDSDEPTPIPVDSDEPTPNPVDSDEPTPNPVDSDEPTPNPVDSDEPTPNPVDSDEPTPNPVDSDEPTSNPVDSDEPTSNPVDSDEPTSNPVDSDEPTSNPVDSDEPTPNPVDSDDPTPNPVDSDKPTPNPVDSDEPTPNPVDSDESTPNPVDSDEPTPNPVDSDSTVTIQVQPGRYYYYFEKIEEKLTPSVPTITYAAFPKADKAHAQFREKFLQNNFEISCAICDILWYKNDLKESRGRPWRPSHNTSVCSLHFVNGEKSSEQYNPSFVPTIFPKGHIPSTDPGLLDWMKRVKLQPQNTCVVHPPLHRTASVGCQTDPYIDVSMNAPDMMFCWQNGVDAATQTRLNQTSSKSNEISRTDRTNANPSMLPKADQSSGSDKAMIFGFMGSQDAQSDRAMSQLAGVSLRFFRSLLTFITYADGQLAYRNVLKENRLLIFLMKMKLGISFSALGRLFGVTDRIAAMIFYQVLETLTEKTRNWIVWPSKDYVQKNMPSTFCEYRNCRCIFDCVEIRTETPPTCQQKTLLYSNSKHCYTIKFLVVTTPDGFVRKVSKAYEGRATDSFIAKDCGFLNLLEPGDLILADKRFSAIESELSKRDCTLVIPPLAVNPQYADEKSDKTHRTASVRTHLERSIQRIKVLHILDYFSSDQLPYVDAIMHMCCVIVNSLPSLSDGK